MDKFVSGSIAVISYLSAMGAGKVVASVITEVLPKESTKIGKGLAKLGVLVISLYASKKIADYVEDELTTIHKDVKVAVEAVVEVLNDPNSKV